VTPSATGGELVQAVLDLGPATTRPSFGSRSARRKPSQACWILRPHRHRQRAPPSSMRHATASVAPSLRAAAPSPACWRVPLDARAPWPRAQAPPARRCRGRCRHLPRRWPIWVPSPSSPRSMAQHSMPVRRRALRVASDEVPLAPSQRAPSVPARQSS
jgi:hypothetical protein